MKRLTVQKMREMILERARQVPECMGISGLGIYQATEPGHPNWTISGLQNASGHGASTAIYRIARELAEEYEVQWPAESFDLTMKATVYADPREPLVAEPVLETTLAGAIVWARRQKPGLTYAIYIHEHNCTPRPLLQEELQFLFLQIP
jgi:hypothetical protein